MFDHGLLIEQQRMTLYSAITTRMAEGDPIPPVADLELQFSHLDPTGRILQELRLSAIARMLPKSTVEEVLVQMQSLLPVGSPLRTNQGMPSAEAFGVGGEVKFEIRPLEGKDNGIDHSPSSSDTSDKKGSPPPPEVDLGRLERNTRPGDARPGDAVYYTDPHVHRPSGYYLVKDPKFGEVIMEWNEHQAWWILPRPDPEAVCGDSRFEWVGERIFTVVDVMNGKTFIFIEEDEGFVCIDEHGYRRVFQSVELNSARDFHISTFRDRLSASKQQTEATKHAVREILNRRQYRPVANFKNKFDANEEAARLERQIEAKLKRLRAELRAEIDASVRSVGYCRSCGAFPGVAHKSTCPRRK